MLDRCSGGYTMEDIAQFKESSQDLFYEAIMTAPGTLIAGNIWTSARGIPPAHKNVPDMLAACREQRVTPYLSAHYHFSPEHGIFVPRFGEEAYRKEEVPSSALTSGSLDVLLEPGKPHKVSVEVYHWDEARQAGVQEWHRTASHALQENFLPFLRRQGYDIDSATVCFTNNRKSSFHFSIHHGYKPSCLDVFIAGEDKALQSEVADWLTPLKEKYR